MHYKFGGHPFEILFCDSLIFPIFLPARPLLTVQDLLGEFSWHFLSIPCWLEYYIFFSTFLYLCGLFVCNCVYFRPKRNYFTFRFRHLLYGPFSILLNSLLLHVSCGLTLLSVHSSRYSCTRRSSCPVFHFVDDILISSLLRLSPAWSLFHSFFNFCNLFNLINLYFVLFC